MTRSWCSQKQIPKWETTKITQPKLQIDMSFVDLKLFIANVYSNANASANFAKAMH